MPSLTDPILSSQLDDEQIKVASAVDRNLLVLAPPGSGKTRVLVNAAAHRVRHAEALLGYRHARVLCLTFGTDAAREMQMRLGSRPLSVPRNRMWVGNYHGVASYLLRRYGHLIGWPRDAGVIPAPSNERVLAEAIEDLGIRGLKARGAVQAISTLKGRRDVVDDAGGRLHELRQRYDDILRERRLRDFDDLILHAIELLRNHPSVQRILQDAYPFLFVDELQDTNLLQIDLLQLLAGDRTRVFAVADDDQMIYGWRDAYPENIDEFVGKFDADEQSLIGNYRCPPRIVDAANRVIVLNERRREVLMESRVEDTPGDVVVLTADSAPESDLVVAEIVRSLDEGIPLGMIAILAPHHFKFDDVEAALEDSGLRYVHVGQSRLTTRLIQTLRLALHGVAGGIIAETDASEIVRSESDTTKVMDAIAKAVARGGSGTPRGLLNRLLAEFGLGSTSNPKREPDGVRILARMVRKALDEGDPSTPSELAELLIRDWDRLERAAVRAEEAIKVMTTFAAKGTEYEVVILPFLNEGIVPYARRGEEVDWQEARRLFYVALTRAMRRVVLIYDGDRPKSELLEAVEGAATEHAVR